MDTKFAKSTKSNKIVSVQYLFSKIDSIDSMKNFNRLELSPIN